MTMKIDFSFSSQYGTFSDALHLPDDHAFTDAEIEAMKQQRFDNWIAVITAPPVEETPVEETPVEETPSEEV
jgi:hypothetical protein